MFAIEKVHRDLPRRWSPKKLNLQERASIIAFLECGKKIPWISAKFWISVTTVRLWKKRHQETGIRNGGSGKNKKITPIDEENIVSEALAKPITTAQEKAGVVYNEKIIWHFPINYFIDVTQINAIQFLPSSAFLKREKFMRAEPHRNCFYPQRMQSSV